MTKLQQWNANEEKQLALQELLGSPVMQEALDLVRAACIPKAREADNPESITTLYALDYSRATGWYGAINMLEALQKISLPTRKTVAQPWKHKDSEPTPQ